MAPQPRSWTSRDAILYALGVGAGPDELAYTTENSHGVEQRAVPTMAIVLGLGSAALSRVGDIDRGGLLHAGQALRLHRPLPVEGSILVSAAISRIEDHGPGGHAIVEITADSRHATGGDSMFECRTTLLVRGFGGFGGDPARSPAPPAPPRRPPDEVRTQPTLPIQALLYRLSADPNPIHSDPWFAQERAGLPAPILQGPCTLGFAARALIACVAGGNPDRVAAIEARFRRPAYPGEALTTRIWATPGGAVFETRAGDDDRVVIDGGRFELR